MALKKSSIRAVTYHYYKGKAPYYDDKGKGLNTILTGDEVKKLLERGSVKTGAVRTWKITLKVEEVVK